MVKKIHYIWLGGKKKPAVIRKCINSWKKNMPDWKIIEWNENNLNIDINKYCRQAYDSKNYAFAADVLRFYILYMEGGLYFDTDVKLLKSMDTLVVKNDAFCGFEFSMVAPGLVLYVKKPKNRILLEILEKYNHTDFIIDGKYNKKVVGEYFSEVLEKYGFNYKNEYQKCGDFTIFPRTYFCPTDAYGNNIAYSKNTYSVHLYAGSWLPKKKRIVNNFKRVAYKHLGLNRIQSIMKIIKKVSVKR